MRSTTVEAMRSARGKDKEKYMGRSNEKYKGRGKEKFKRRDNKKYKGRTKVVQYLSVMQTYRRNTGIAALALNLTTYSSVAYLTLRLLWPRKMSH
jgi:hypothetical protein